ncbi:SDR family oxidoreductase [Microbacterium sp. A196]|uniref:SDR family oxidoreductase n=1 Tax=unclassified Microbacterium TaxID=2609290 RepID=UPI003FD52136
MKIAVTGASGQLGALIIESLLERGVAAADIVAIARTPQKVAAEGVAIRQADYDDPSSLDTALDGVERLLLVSGSEIGQRFAQHSNVIDAAKRAGVSFIGYTSLINADSSTLILADEHRATEAALAGSGLPYTVLRNGWYTENYTAGAAGTVAQGMLLGGAGGARIAAATRKDYADAAAVVLLEPKPGETFELGGEGVTLQEFASALAEVSGKPVEYRDHDGDELIAAIVATGAPEGFAQWTASADAEIAKGVLDTDSTALEQLIGRRPTSLVQAARTALAG